MFAVDALESIQDAIRQEIAAGKSSVKMQYLDIDAIDHLSDVPGAFVYRLVLSSPQYFSPDQRVEFHNRSPKETIKGTIVLSDDQGVVIECEKPLASDAKLVSMSFNPSFILNNLEEFLLDMERKPTDIARMVYSKTILPPSETIGIESDTLNREQTEAVSQMLSSPVYLLWGPPGTGKTTTIASAVLNWMKRGKSVLIVCTSNAAVDVAMRAIIQQSSVMEHEKILRMGQTLDPTVQGVTYQGKLIAANPALAAKTQKAQRRLQEIRELLANRNLQSDKRQQLFAEIDEKETTLTAFNEQVKEALPGIDAKVLVAGCTLASMVLQPTFRKKGFDVVIVDESSMAPLLFSLSASFLAKSHIVYAGDPKQLPPIVQSKHSSALKWFGKNIYDWFDVESKAVSDPSDNDMLLRQYRMTNEIGSFVSRLMYGGRLQNGVERNGTPVEFIDVGKQWQTTHYSVAEESYFHLSSIPIIHALQKREDFDELLLLTPFRPQRSLLSAIAFDLISQKTSLKASASTIHRSQGAEADTVIVDLTTHSPKEIVSFFKDQHSSKLFNVAVSRAKERLIIIGSMEMLKVLGNTNPFWSQVVNELKSSLKIESTENLLQMFDQYESLGQFESKSEMCLPSLFCYEGVDQDYSEGVSKLKNAKSTRKLLVTTDTGSEVYDGDLIVRYNDELPPAFTLNGTICLPHSKGWTSIHSPNASSVVWRIGYSHLADMEINANQSKRFFCPQCTEGELVIRYSKETGWFLGCNQSTGGCIFRKHLTLKDLEIKVKLQGMTCSKGHPLAARNSGNRLFIGCENYPACTFSQNVGILNGV